MIPDWLRQSLASPPTAGAGIHAWLFSTARQLHAHMPPEAVGAALMASTAASGRRVTEREIRDAVANSRAIAWARGAKADGVRGRAALPKGAAGAGARWPAVMLPERRAMISRAAATGVRGVADLWERSPRRGLGALTCDDWLDWLFPGAGWLCLATDHPATARSRPPQKWSFGPADGCGLVVPSPMSGPSGKALDGSTSHRCLANTGPRRWLVIEFDSGTLDEQAALHWHLDQAAAAVGWPRLALVVLSGGKSVHGWYGLCGEESSSRAMMEYAVTLGADPMTWNRSQLVRLPGGLRRATTVAEREGHHLPDGWEAPAEVRQAVVYWNPTILCNTLGNNNFTAPEERLDSVVSQAVMVC